MEWDQILRFSTFKVKQVSMPKEDSGILRFQLVKRADSKSLCTRCVSPLTRRHSFRRCQVE